MAYQLFDLLYDQQFSGKNIATAAVNRVVTTLEKYFLNDELETVHVEFNKVRGNPFTKLLTKWGLCLNFNLEPMESLLHVDKYC